jgi:hypothetical protein
MKRTQRVKQRKRGGTQRIPRTTFIEKIEPYKICNITNSTDRVSCGIYCFDCERMEENEYVTRIAKIAKSQKDYFYEIFPWKMKCKVGWKMFIALRVDERTQKIIICAWCSVRYEELPRPERESGIKTAYIVEVSVRRKKKTGEVDEDYKGMGIKILKEIMESSEVSMVYLVPSNEAVKNLYMSRLGMNEVPNTSYLVKSMSPDVTIQVMKEIITLKRQNEIEQETQIYNQGLQELDETIRQVFIQKIDALQMELDDKIAVLGEIAMMMEGQEVTNDEIIDYINELDQ